MQLLASRYIGSLPPVLAITWSSELVTDSEKRENAFALRRRLDTLEMQSPAGQPQVSGHNVTGGKKSASHLRYATRRTPLNPYFVLGICALGILCVSFMSWDIEQVNIGPLKTKYSAYKDVVTIPYPGKFPPSEEHPEGTYNRSQRT